MNRKILLIDDEIAFLDGIKQMLQLRNIEISTANSWQTALSILKHTEFEIVITDILMPAIDGIEVIVYLQTHFPDIKIIAISGGGRISARDYLDIASGFRLHGILEKPFSIDELIDMINF
jgi:YesN/AraC family two-component response regulator